jgi:hypothetical protein
MGNQMQEYFEREELQKDGNNIKNFNKAITKSNNDLLREYYTEFCKDDNNTTYVLGAYKFLQFIIANK